MASSSPRPLRWLVVSPGMTPSLLLVALRPLAWLTEEGIAEHRFRIPYEIRAEDLAWADVVYAVRSATPLERRICGEAQRLGRKTILALDDNLLEVPREATCYPYYSSPRIRKSLAAIVRSADLVLTPTAHLEPVCRRVGREGPIARCPVPALLLEAGAPAAPKGEGEAIVIGFAGGVDGTAYLDRMLSEPLRALCAERGERVRFEFFGGKPTCCEAVGGTHLPFEEDWEAYRRTLLARGWDIGLAPLFDTPFHRCKYYNKFLEYGAAGIAGVYAAMPPYTDVIRDGANGLLATASSAAWYAALKRLIDDAALRRNLAAEARREVEAGHRRGVVCVQWRCLVERFALGPAPTVNAQQVRWSVGPRNRLVRRLVNFVDLYGASSPYRALLWLLWKCGLRRTAS